MIQPDTETLLAVVLGALLATAGGFTERQVERLVQKREKEHSAALLFGELLSSMRVMMRLGNEARGRGDPFGSVTMRFVRGVQREIDIFMRNRETMVDLRDPSIRAAVNVLIARLSFALDGVSDATAEIATVEHTLRSAETTDPEREAAKERLVSLRETRKVAFDFAAETAFEIAPLLTRLAPLARHDFGATQSAVPQDIFAQQGQETG
jgi:hypothetical protein